VAHHPDVAGGGAEERGAAVGGQHGQDATLVVGVLLAADQARPLQLGDLIGQAAPGHDDHVGELAHPQPAARRPLQPGEDLVLRV
jgi:hypothetical protein